MPQDRTAAAGLGRRSALTLGLAGLGLLRPCAPAGAQTSAATSWPDRPVRLVVPFGAGGAADTLSRAVSQAFAPAAGGQSMPVENRAGAGGTIAGAFVAQQRPDGYTLMMSDLGANAIGKALQPSVPYDPMTSFTAICHVATLPLVLVVPASLPATDLPALLALAKQRGDMPYAHPGIGYVGHLAHELMLRRANLTMTPIPYRSGAEVLRSLLAGDTLSTIMTVSTSLPQIREGKLRPLAVLSAEPVALLPGVPPLSATLPGVEATVWNGVMGPAGMAPELVARINAVVNVAIRSPDVRRVVVEVQAGEVVGGTPAQFAALIQAEYERWAPVIREAGIRVE
jgi:tripartite-type tricarboxylate transporter receptor subunit TctC